MATEWTEELKTNVIEAYVAMEPTPETTMDCLKKVSDDFDVTLNGARTIIVKADKYVKKVPAASAASTDKPKSTRVSKADAQQTLTDLIESLGKEADDSVISKLTGKAALYLVDVFKQS